MLERPWTLFAADGGTVADTRSVRRQERGKQRMAQILDAALELFGELGYRAVSTNAIAARAGISPQEAIAIANDVAYGLAAGVWTQNMRRALKMADRLQAGTVWINTYRAISYMSPFGGYKRSGIGRESGHEAIKEYLQVKSVWISTATDVANPFIQR